MPTPTAPIVEVLEVRDAPAEEVVRTPSIPIDVATPSPMAAAVRSKASAARIAPSTSARDQVDPPRHDADEERPNRTWAYVGIVAAAVLVFTFAVRFTENAPHATTAAPAAATFADLPANADVPTGYGVFELATRGPAVVRIDGEERGFGPRFTVALPPGTHEIRSGDERPRSFEIRAGKTTRVDLASVGRDEP
jgi:hypothetical protein